jgi:hypothetical protein
MQSDVEIVVQFDFDSICHSNGPSIRFRVEMS